jgi:hypothetical protein
MGMSQVDRFAPNDAGPPRRAARAAAAAGPLPPQTWRFS